MNTFPEIIRKRTIPGVVIFDSSKRMLFSNEEALVLAPELEKIFPDGAQASGILQSIYQLCDQVKDSVSCVKSNINRSEIVHCTVRDGTEGQLLALRAFPTKWDEKEGSSLHIMVLLERAVEKRSVDYKIAGSHFDLSRREIEVLERICEGLSNRDIASHLFISEYTVKDHLKKIMRKMGCSSRNEIISSLR